MVTKTKEKTPVKWKLNQDDYLELLESIDKNAKTILQLTNDVKRLKIRIGI
jgi:hypothetical protein